MLLGFVMLFAAALLVWLVFFKFKWLKFSIAWAIFSSMAIVHLLIIFLIGLRFMAPLATEARIDPAHHPAGAPPVRTHAGHGRAGAAQRAGQEGAAVVPVRPPPL